MEKLLAALQKPQRFYIHLVLLDPRTIAYLSSSAGSLSISRPVYIQSCSGDSNYHRRSQALPSLS
jgi:hypothetical protein